MKKNTKKRRNQQEQVLGKLVRKLSKPKSKNSQDAITSDHEERNARARHRDVDGERDWDIQDVDADTLFREMRRREY